jgi:DNA-binding MarR family transcriptional regulator
VTAPPERSLLLDLYAAFFKSGQIVEAAVEGTGIGPEDFAFVSIVGMREPVTPTAISREFGHSLSTVLFRAGRNVELGFVERISNPQDGRSFLLRLTPAGRDVWHRAASNLERAVTALEARLERPAAEIQQVLRELQAAFDAELADPGRLLSRR